MERLDVGCKINIFLKLTGRRANGYHDLVSLFLYLDSPHDTMTIAESTEAGIHLRCAVPDIDLEKNTVTKAWKLYADATGFAPALDVELIKGIPHGAGLGGGSADGAEMLLYLNRINKNPVEKRVLHELAARIGADVPFFLEKKPCLVEGIGDKLTPLADDSPWMTSLQKSHGVLLCPDVQVNTAWAYGAWDDKVAAEALNGAERGAESRSKALTDTTGTDKNLRSVLFPPLRVENDFESVVFARWPELAELKALLLRCGAYAACMSGSGSSLFGLFRNAEDIRGLEERMREYKGNCLLFRFTLR